jgi:polyvinyl alcohol dehydrogenase (cytochrome)
MRLAPILGPVLLVSCGGSSSAPPDWPMYGFDALHTFTAKGSPITSKNVAMLEQAWSFPTGDAVTATPAVVGGVVYVGSWDGFFYALDAKSGALVWKVQLDCDGTIAPIPPQCLAGGQMPPDRTGTDGGLVTSSALIAGGRVFFGSGKTMYCLDAKSGALVWKKVICGNFGAPGCEMNADDKSAIFSSPVIFENKLIFGHTTDGGDGYRGGIVALDPTSGSLVWRFEVDPILNAEGTPKLTATGTSAGGVNRGCGSVWGSGAIDEKSRTVFFGTGDCNGDSPPPYHETVLALDIDHGTVKWAFRPREHDVCDFDFGSTANILDIGGKRMVGIGGKDGTYYALDAVSSDPKGTLVWSKNVVFGGPSGGFIGSTAFDGRHIFGATAFGELGDMGQCAPGNPRDMQVEDPSFHAFNAADGSVAWENNKAYAFSPATVVNDVVFSGVGQYLPGALRAYSTSDGTKVFEATMDGAVNSGVAVVGKMIFFGSGNSFNGKGGAVQAYAIP